MVHHQALFMTTIEKLKLPSDPRDLIDLYDLRDRIIIRDTIVNNLDKYVEDYYFSFCKSFTELFDILPKPKAHLYKFVNDIRIPLGFIHQNGSRWIGGGKYFYIFNHLTKEIVIVPEYKNVNLSYKTQENDLIIMINFNLMFYIPHHYYIEAVEVNGKMELQNKVYNARIPDYVSGAQYISGTNFPISKNGGIENVTLKFDMRTNQLISNLSSFYRSLSPLNY